MEGVVKELVPAPPGKTAPPDAAAYQSMASPVPGVAEIVIVPVPQRTPFVPTGLVGNGMTVASTAALVGARHPASKVLAWAK